MRTKHVIILSSMAILSSCNMQPKLSYPETAKDEVTDSYFGTDVADPYRWLENDTTQATAAWVEAQNRVTDQYLSRIPFRQDLKQRFTNLTNYEKYGIPFKRNNKYYFYKNDGLQNQSVLYVKESLDGEAGVLLDPNKFSEDGTVSLKGVYFSNNGKYMAYARSHSGSDWLEFFVMDLSTGQLTGDHIQWAKISGVSWQGDGFYYSAYDAPTEGKEYSNVNENHKVYYHRIGEPQAKDKLVFQNPKEPKRFYTAGTSKDEQSLFIYESGAGFGNALFIKDLTKAGSPIVQIAEDLHYTHHPIEVINNKLYLYTNWGAPKYRIMVTDVKSPQLKNWKELIPEGDAVLADVGVVDGKLLLTYEKDASHHVYIHTLEGKLIHKVELPTLGSVNFSGTKDDKEIFYSLSSFTFPGTIFSYDIDKNSSKLYMAPNVQFTPDEFETQQVFFPSKDGTKIPMFLVHKKGIQKDGNNPVLLYGYGGFNVSLTPSFSTYRLPFLENGGIYVMVNLRGGGEYGEEWHQAGTKMNKQNVFDDFIAAAEWMINNGYTNSNKIAIQGGSNGGLLIGACVNQRPDLFKAAIPQVGVMDMLRYHKFTIGWNWASDYGTSEESREMFEYLYAYSPLHNIKNDGTPYPAIMITTADHDDRVVPAHSFKYAAALQAANTGDAAKVIRIETKAGHGSGKPIGKIIEEQTDIYAFIMHNLGMTTNFK